MKKFVWCMFLLLFSLLLQPTFSLQVSAETQKNLNIKTYYPENILDYADLTNVSFFSNNDNYIAYTLDNTNLIVFEKATRKYTTITGFNTITKIKYIDNSLLVADNTNIKIITDLSVLEASELDYIEDLTTTYASAIDIYYANNNIYIGLVKSNTFMLFQFSNDFTNTKGNPVKTATFDYFANTYMLAINNNNAYIVVNQDDPRLYTLNYLSNTPTPKEFIRNARIIDTFYHNSQECILTFTQEILYLLSTDCVEIDSVNIGKNGEANTSKFPILEISDFNYFDGVIYVSDKKCKSIQSFDLIDDENNLLLQSKEILLCSNSQDIGRFNNVNNIYVQGNTIYTTDTNNNRIQILENGKSSIINDLEADAYPKSILTDHNNNIYFIKDNLNNSILVKYTKNDDDIFEKVQEYHTINNSSIGSVSDITITNSNIVYLLDYTNNQFVCLTDNGLETKKDLSNHISLNKNSQIEYLKGLDNLVVLTDSNLYLLGLNGDIISQLNLPNTTKITCDLNCIYAYSNNSIKLVNIENSTLCVSDKEITSESLNNITTIFFEITNRTMYGFDSIRNCIVTFDCNLKTTPFTKSKLNNSTLTSNDIFLPITIKNAPLIFEYPYYLGNFYNSNNTIKTCFGIEEYNDYYKILFNNNNTIQSGYILKTNCIVENFTYNPINVLTTQQLVPIYKYPTILEYENDLLITERIPINTKITLNAIMPISIDTKTFYVYKYNGNIGFIFNADVVLDETTNIAYLNTENAELKSFDSDKITIYEDNKRTKIIDVNNNTRIYVDKFDKNSKYTKIIYKDSNLRTIEGYVLTEYVVMDKLDNSQLIIILVIVISVILLITILIFYLVLKKKKS